MKQAAEFCAQSFEQPGNTFEEGFFQNSPALFTSLRVKASEIPEGLHLSLIHI